MRVLADQDQVARIIDRLATQIARDVADVPGSPRWALVGIRSRGDILADRLAKILHPDEVGTIDITLYRDDLSAASAQPVVRTTEIPFAIDGLHVVLVDDVLMTGRSVRAAMQSLMDLGRPKRIWLAVLVDRGGRELPIAADQVGLDLTGRTSAEQVVAPGQRVEVWLKPTDVQDQIIVREAQEKGA